LIVQRGEASDHPYKWEFPGGKLAAGETEDDCIIREIREELSMEIVIFGRLPAVEHDYGMKQIRLIPFVCDTLDELPILSEHIAYKWVEPKDLLLYDYSEADVFVAKSYIGDKKAGEILPRPKEEQSEPSENADFNDFQDVVNKMMSTREAEWVAASAIENPAVFRKLYEYSFSPDQHLAFRASWTLTKVCDKYPELITPYLPEIITSITKIQSEGALRSFLRILSLSEMNNFSSDHHGILIDFCFELLRSGTSAIAVKAYSMEILYKLSIMYPELINELSATLLIVMEDASAGIKARANAILRKMLA
jgi:8-oxo-dGTP diphosphatase